MENCPVTYTISIIGGKWKPVILFKLFEGINRFSQLEKSIQGINKQMLSKQLKELEKDKIITRTVFPEIPPHVEYALTEKGKSLFWIIESMKIWGEENIPD